MKKILGVLVAVVFAVVLFAPISNAVAANSGTADVTNETLSAQVGTYQDLDHYDVNQGTVTVYWYNSTSGSYETLTNGTDYEIAYSNGSVKTLSGGDVSDGDDLKVSYEWQQTDPMTTTIITLVPLLLLVMIIVVMSRAIEEKM